jgi:hypothetical protein
MRRAHIAVLLAAPVLLCRQAEAQIDTTLLRITPKDTAVQSLNMDAVYERSLVNIGRSPAAIGGYMEANWQHLGSDGVSEGHQLQFRRLTLFLSAGISERIHFLSEIEFENGAEEISVELAAMDITFHPLLHLRGGILLNPIGAFNQNHDGPKWEFTDRPIPATHMLPATWSNAGFGVFGKQYVNNWVFGYEFYLSGGFDNSIIRNTENKTFLPAAKENPHRFEASAGGEPLVTGKIVVGKDVFGEVGLSYMGGVYNDHQDGGFVLDTRRRCDVIAVDYSTILPTIDTRIVGEWAWIFVDVPPTYSQQFGDKQRGGFVDIVHPLLRGPILGWSDARVNVACRIEYVDWNVGSFRETGGDIGDDLWSIMPAVSFRPTALTVIRLNYRYQKQRDLLGNPPVTTAGFIFGISTYF